MLTEDQILSTLDNSNKQGWYNHFLDLGHAYSFLIDCRLNVFRDGKEKWAIAAERLGYNPRAGSILLEIFYYGNCLINLEYYNGQSTNYYTIYLVDGESFNEATYGEALKPNAKNWLVHNKKIKLSTKKKDYIKAGIDLCQDLPNQIRVEEAARLVVIKYRDVFRATDDELYKSIPADLKKIFVIDEWYHKEFNEIIQPPIDNEHLKQTFEFNKGLQGDSGLDFETFSALFGQQEVSNNSWNQNQWQDNRPGSYETWQQIAKVIVTGDTSFYEPTLKANTHWKNWPDSGSL